MLVTDLKLSVMGVFLICVNLSVVEVLTFLMTSFVMDGFSIFIVMAYDYLIAVDHFSCLLIDFLDNFVSEDSIDYVEVSFYKDLLRMLH